MTPLVFALAMTVAQTDVLTSSESAVARAISLSLPYNTADGSLRWSPLGVRLGREVNWHLAEPGSGPVDNLPGVFRRVGWMRARGVTSTVAVCGDQDQVRAVTLSLSDRQIETEGLIEELAALGISATLTARVEAVPVRSREDGRIDEYHQAILAQAPARETWTIRKSNLAPAELTAERICTPPGTAHATHCWLRVTVRFDPEAQPPFACPLPGRYGA